MGKVTSIKRANEPPKRYTSVWRNKWLTEGAKSIEEMSAVLRKAADLLDEMAKAGVTLYAESGGMEDDYAPLVTTDAAAAKKFGFEAEEVEDEEA